MPIAENIAQDLPIPSETGGRLDNSSHVTKYSLKSNMSGRNSTDKAGDDS